MQLFCSLSRIPVYTALCTGVLATEVSGTAVPTRFSANFSSGTHRCVWERLLPRRQVRLCPLVSLRLRAHAIVYWSG